MGTRGAGLSKEQFAVGFVGGQGIERAYTAETFAQCEGRIPSTAYRDRQCQRDF